MKVYLNTIALFILSACGGETAQNLKCGPLDMGGNYEHATLGADVRITVFPVSCQVVYVSDYTSCVLGATISGTTDSSGTLNLSVTQKTAGCGEPPADSTCAYQSSATTLTLACQGAGLSGDFTRVP